MVRARGNIRYLMTPGPVEISPRVLRAMSRPSVHPLYSGFGDFFEETIEKLKKVFQTKSDIVLQQGEAILGLEAAMACTVNPGDKVLVCDSGPFGYFFGVYVDMYGGKADYLTVEYNDAIDPEDVEKKLREDKDIKSLTVVHHETPAGTMNPIKDICKTAKEHDVLTIVDAVSSVGGTDVRPDDWGIDICIVGSEKCLASVNMTVMSVSEAAWATMEKKEKPMTYSYLSLPDFREQWIKNRVPSFVFGISELYALNEAATMLLEEGLQNVFARHEKVGKACRKGIKGMGLELWPKTEEIAAPMVTAVKIPDGVDDQKVRSIMTEKYGVLIAGSLFALAGKVWRIGHMGYGAALPNVLATLAALEGALSAVKYPVELGSGVAAALKA